MFDQFFLGPNNELTGAIIFPFSDKELLYKMPDSQDPFYFDGSSYTDKTLSNYVTSGDARFPIKGSTLKMQFVNNEGKVINYSIVFKNNYREKKITPRQDSEPEKIVVDDLPKDKWPEW